MDCIDILVGCIDQAERLNPEDAVVISQADVALVEQQEKTKRIFFEACITVYGEKKLDQVCKRYYGISFSSLMSQKGPLKASVVQNLELGASYLTISDLKNKFLDNQDLFDLTPEELKSWVDKINPIPYTGIPIRNIDSNPSEFHALFFYNRALQDKELLQLFLKMKQLEDTPSKDELLAKGIIYRDLDEGDLIYYGKDLFYVYQTIITGHGFIAYCLKPLCKSSDEPPIIAFRGTQVFFSGLDAISVLKNNTEPHIGTTAYYSGKDHLEKVLSDPDFCTKDQKVKVIGFSFGALLAERSIADFPEKIKKASLFSALGVDDITANRFLENVNQRFKETDSIEITYYRVDCDSFDSFGGYLIGHGAKDNRIDVDLYYISPYLNFPTGGFAHTYRFFSEGIDCYSLTRVEKEKLDEHLDNSKRGIWVLGAELVRKAIGPYFLSPFFQMVKVVKRSLFGWRAEDKVSKLSKVLFDFPSVDKARSDQMRVST